MKRLISFTSTTDVKIISRPVLFKGYFKCYMPHELHIINQYSRIDRKIFKMMFRFDLDPTSIGYGAIEELCPLRQLWRIWL